MSFDRVLVASKCGLKKKPDALLRAVAKPVKQTFNVWIAIYTHKHYKDVWVKYTLSVNSLCFSLSFSFFLHELRQSARPKLECRPTQFIEFMLYLYMYYWGWVGAWQQALYTVQSKAAYKIIFFKYHRITFSLITL